MRAHWGVGNQLHWSLNATFREDDTRIRRENSSTSFNTLWRFSLNPLKRFRSSMNKRQRRYTATLDDYFRANILCQQRRVSFGSATASSNGYALAGRLRVITHPQFPQIRTCPIRASGSTFYHNVGCVFAELVTSQRSPRNGSPWLARLVAGVAGSLASVGNDAPRIGCGFAALRIRQFSLR
jgi:hypothetical protein